MQHCLFNSYVTRIAARQYLAFHIDAPDLAPAGFTLGLKIATQDVYVARMDWNWDDSAITSDQKPSLRHKGEWSVDQVRGIRNHIPRDNELDKVCEMI